jgi:hypothetical protein
MKILVLNWGIAAEYSWQHALFEEMVYLGCEFVIISAKKAWAPRGGKIYPREEQYSGIKYFRLYDDIPHFKGNLINDVDFILEMLKEKFDVVWAFHQANWYIGKEFASKLKCKLVVTCEQAFRTSGLQSGHITDRWKEIMATTNLIISWAPQDEKHEKQIGVKYLPFGGCFPDIEKKWVGYGEKIKSPTFGIYQGSLSPNFKNQDAMVSDIDCFLENKIVDKFVINGYPLTEKSNQILKVLKSKWGDRFEYSMLIGRENVLDSLKGALFGYSPMKPAILSNFPYEAFGTGVPMYMPYVKNAADYIITEKEELLKTIKDRRTYVRKITKAKAYYDATHSVEMMGQNYYNAIGAIL